MAKLSGYICDASLFLSRRSAQAADGILIP
jgi:hypothetical protein